MDKNVSHTTNKSDRELGNKFDIKDFNKKFEENDMNPKAEIAQKLIPKKTSYNVNMKIQTEDTMKTESVLSELSRMMAEQEKEQTQDKKDNKMETIELLKQMNQLPHQKPVGLIIKDTQLLIVKIFNMISEGNNPIPILFSSLDNHFSITIFIIGIALLLLFLNNLLS